MKVHQLQVGNMQNFTYILEDEKTSEAMTNTTGAKIIQHEASTLKHDIIVKDGDKIRFGESEVVVFHTPGHSKDSICLVGDGKILTGDTLFVGNCGRVDLPGGSANELYHSLFDVLAKLDDKLVMYSGHNYGTKLASTLGQEKETNFVMQPRTEAEFVELLGG